MILKGLRNLAVAAALAGCIALPALAANGADEALLGAFDAYRAGDPIKLAKHAKKLDGHLLAPWLDYWRLSLRLEDAPRAEVREFLSTYADAYVAERLRGEWLRVLGRRTEWAEFEREAAAYGGEDELEVRCYGWVRRLEQGDDSAFAEASVVWVEPRELPEGCAKLANTMVTRGRISITDTWQRVRILFEAGQITAAKTTLGYLKKDESPDERSLAEAARRPKRFLQGLPASLERRPTREVAVLAALRYAREDPESAADLLLGRLGERLPEREARYLWGRVALEGARQHHPDALAWYARAGEATLDDEQLAWKARAALRVGEWRTVRAAIDRMSPEERTIPTWTYWYGRSLVAAGDEASARAYFLRIAAAPEFYGLLANDELGQAIVQGESYSPSEEELDAAKRDPGLARALELIRLGLRNEGVREWQFAIRFYDDPRLIAAAELALRAEVYDRSIHTADRTVYLHNFALRYPVPYRELFGEYAKSRGLDEAWVLGLVRQESRFISEARSSAGAAGLMQVMPRTARYVASRTGMRNYRAKSVTEVQTNVQLGTSYLKLVLDQLGHPVLASAAYNAGPGRAKRWRDPEKSLEGAIYAETIPFGETRRYVKKVMANSVFYSQLMHTEPKPLKQRLGTIPPRGVAASQDDE